MASLYPNPHRSTQFRTNTKSQLKKRAHQPPPPSTIINKSKQIQKRLIYPNPSTMSKRTSILKRKSFEIDNTNFFIDEKQPSDIQPITLRKSYSPIHTPPRFRTLITPPDLTLYRNNFNFSRITSPLPRINDSFLPTVNLDTWNVNSTDMNLIRRYPSPLSRYGLGNRTYQRRKSYIVVPRLTNLMSPPVSRYGAASFYLPSRRLSSLYIPDVQYSYLERLDSFSSSRFHRAPSDYVYLRKNEAFANEYIETLIGKYIQDQLLPDILLEIISELDQESKKQGGRSYQKEIDQYYTELNQRKNQIDSPETHLFSDEWIHELDYQRPSPMKKSVRVRFHDLPSDAQGRLLADINKELIEFEIQDMMRELSNQTLTARIRTVPPMVHPTRLPAYSDPIQEIKHDNRSIDQGQRLFLENHLIDTICLNQLLTKYLKQSNTIIDYDDQSRLLDLTILGNLISQYQTIDEHRSRTLDNYATRKFHLNSYMNVTMDLLLTELSGSLIEDVKDLDDQEHRTLVQRNIS